MSPLTKAIIAEAVDYTNQVIQFKNIKPQVILVSITALAVLVASYSAYRMLRESVGRNTVKLPTQPQSFSKKKRIEDRVTSELLKGKSMSDLLAHSSSAHKQLDDQIGQDIQDAERSANEREVVDYYIKLLSLNTKRPYSIGSMTYPMRKLDSKLIALGISRTEFEV